MKKIWLITGVSSGLGKALAKKVMSAGDIVAATFRKESDRNAFNKAAGDQGSGHLLELTDVAACSALIDKLTNKYGRIDVLVNNAGVGFVGAVEEASETEVRKVFDINFFGALALTRAVLPHMRKAGSGSIIQVSSHGGVKAFAGFGIYNASKFALEGLSEALAQEVEPLGIRVTLVEPGPFRTAFAASSLGEAENQYEDYAPTAGNFRKKLKSVDGKQEGDPAKAAAAMYELVYSENPPLRLPLCKTALATIGMKLDSVRADLERSRQVAKQAVF